MKTKVFTIGAIVVLCLWASFEFAYISRIISDERVRTKGAFKVELGTNYLYLSLPKGSYQCGFYNNVDMKNAFNVESGDDREQRAEIEVSQGGRTLVPQANTHWTSFHINDNDYAVVEIQTILKQKMSKPVYLIVGGAF